MENQAAVTDIWKLYQMGKNYNSELNLYETIKINERFASGDQWHGVQVENLPKPQFNVFDRVINYFIAYLTSSPYTIRYTSNKEIAVKLDEFGRPQLDEFGRPIQIDRMKALNDLADELYEDNQITHKLKQILRDGCVSGDMCFYTFWDTEINAGNGIKGNIVTELIDGVNVIFGDPNNKIVNRRGKAYQPYVLIVGRENVYKLKTEAKQNKENPELICADLENEYQAGILAETEMDGTAAEKATWVLKMWYDKDTGTVKHSKATRTGIIYKDKDTKIPIYPIVWGNWKSVKDCYHGQALITPYIPNQKFINKQMAIAMVHTMLLAMPTKIYDKTRIQRWKNQAGAAIEVSGDVKGAVDYIQGSPVPTGVMDIVNQAIKMTVEAMGANDVLLGNTRTDNASAIAQVVQQATTPLLTQREEIQCMLEDLAEIWFEFIKSYYGDIPRQVGNQMFKASEYMEDMIKPKIEVGESKWWSEIASQQTMDNLFRMKAISLKQYLEHMPDGYIMDKEALLKEVEEQDRMMEQMQMMQQQNAQLQQQVAMQEQEAQQVNAQVEQMLQQRQQALQEAQQMQG